MSMKFKPAKKVKIDSLQKLNPAKISCYMVTYNNIMLVACMVINNAGLDVKPCRNLSCCYDDGEGNDYVDRKRRGIYDTGYYCCNPLVFVLGYT